MKIYNSITRKKEEFVPLIPGKVGIYVCGPTVYNYFHIGNARPFIVFDTLRRYFEYRGYDVTYVQNFTDVDDKMIKAASEQGITLAQLGEKFIAEYYKDAGALGIKPATVHPRATQHIAEIIELIEKLIENGHAYVVENGDVYYDTESFAEYGKLSGQDLSDLKLGARIETNEIKKNPMDFALWKAKKTGEISWESPFSEGRPGWHIECSAMSMKYLGDTFDIHAGGQDLKFPHHENEIAQSRGVSGAFARYWMHNGFINVDGEKMSKSLGNFFTVREVAAKFDLMAVRLFMLSSHYRSPINFYDGLIEQATTALTRIATCAENLEMLAAKNVSSEQKQFDFEEYRSRFIAAMDDDLNTADALGVIFELVKQLNTVFTVGSDCEQAKTALALFVELTSVLGVPTRHSFSIPEDVLELVELRKTARANKDFATSDAIRDKITALGFEIKDTPDGAKLAKI